MCFVVFSHLSPVMILAFERAIMKGTSISDCLRRLLTVSQWNQFHSWPTPAGLRHLIFYSQTNGFDRVIRRAGRRVLIDESAFFQWIDEKQDGLPQRPSRCTSKKIGKISQHKKAS